MSRYDSEALYGLEEWFGQILQNLSPGERRKASRKLGQQLRGANLKRMAANVEPEGNAMEARKTRKEQRRKARGRGSRGKGGKMFRRLRYARYWKIDARADSVEIGPKSRSVSQIAEIHHFGLRGLVGLDAQGNVIRTRYPRRRLLGFDREDEQAVLDVAKEMVELREF